MTCICVGSLGLFLHNTRGPEGWLPSQLIIIILARPRLGTTGLDELPLPTEYSWLCDTMEHVSEGYRVAGRHRQTASVEARCLLSGISENK